jgi:hypothetical protein
MAENRPDMELGGGEMGGGEEGGVPVEVDERTRTRLSPRKTDPIAEAIKCYKVAACSLKCRAMYDCLYYCSDMKTQCWNFYSIRDLNDYLQISRPVDYRG